MFNLLVVIQPGRVHRGRLEAQMNILAAAGDTDVSSTWRKMGCNDTLGRMWWKAMPYRTNDVNIFIISVSITESREDKHLLIA